MVNDVDGDYEVGRGKPPRHTRFKKGQSGNPKGRPRGSKNFYALLTKVLNERVVATLKGRQTTITKQEAILVQFVNQAVTGSFRHAQLLIIKVLPLIEQWAEEMSQIAVPQVSNEKRQGLALEVMEILIQCGEIKLPEGMVYKPTVVEPPPSLPEPVRGAVPASSEES